MISIAAFCGCASSESRRSAVQTGSPPARLEYSTANPASEARTAETIKLASFHPDDENEGSPDQGESTPLLSDSAPAPPPLPSEAGSEDRTLELNQVIASIHATFPLLQAAYQERGIAAGNQTAAWGAFDTKLKASTGNQPLGYYETYRHSFGLSQPLYGGSEIFGDYRLGRGDFEPWYLERQTNDAGEFRAGVRVPLLRDRGIDARRAELWRANYDRQRAEPEIRLQLILFVRDGSVAYWSWVAAGQEYKVAERALQLALQRNDQLKRRVELRDLDPPVLQDNLRTIAQREAKVIELRRKLQQAAIKLSLFYRSPDGTPLIPTEEQPTRFPNPTELFPEDRDADIAMALGARPELAALDLLAERIDVDLSEARNDLLPQINAQFFMSQDVGAPTSSKRDKSEFELEAGVFVDVPVQRRKAHGKMQVARSKLAQISAKRQFTEDKIVAEIQSAFAALEGAFDRLERARESVRLAEYMAEVERRKFDLGESDLLSVFLREQIAIEAAESEIAPLFEYFAAAADYDAALARDWPTSR